MSSEQIDTQRERIRFEIQRGELAKVSYPGGTYAYYDHKTGLYFNDFGQMLRDPDEYNRDLESHYDW